MDAGVRGDVLPADPPLPPFRIPPGAMSLGLFHLGERDVEVDARSGSGLGPHDVRPQRRPYGGGCVEVRASPTTIDSSSKGPSPMLTRAYRKRNPGIAIAVVPSLPWLR